MLDNKNIRNISIIAHVDHGKSTLADRLIEMSGLIKPGEHLDQILDNMELEREKGITIKSQPIRLKFKNVTINLIDTPGHVDFSYEVSRALISCDGAILLVDASQGIQAQTFAHSYAAIEAGLDVEVEYIDFDGDVIESTQEPAKDDIMEKLQEISGEVKILSAKLDGRNIQWNLLRKAIS